MAFELDKVYNFTTLAPSILGGSYTTQKVIGIIKAKQAKQYRDIYTLHEQLIGVIPSLPANINDLTYILLEDSLGELMVIANEYVDLFSIFLVTTVNIRVEIPDTNTATLNVIRTRLAELGILNFNVTTY